MNPLRIGFASVYGWRPHVEHMIFLAGLVRKAGHEALFLACDSDLATCYTRELRDRPDWMECLVCRAGGVRSYPVEGVSSIGGMARSAPATPQSAEWAASSASTLVRFETPEEFAGPEFAALRDRLAGPVATAHAAAAEWIRRERLDAVVVFNGRIDATRGIFEAAREAGIRTISFERTWFGDGIQLFPDENCLGLRSVHDMVARWAGVPLDEAQARVAASYVAARLTATNLKEWRAYNVQAREQAWPVPGGRRKILLLPGSLNEVWGDANWESGWPDAASAFDALIAHLGLQPADVVLRCHPNWAERIGKRDGRHAEQHYLRWAAARGIHAIASADRASTMTLIAGCDAVVLASGSAALEAAAMGKQVISTAPSTYHEAGFRTAAHTPELMRRVVLDVDLPAPEREAAQDRLRRGALRYAYTMGHRLPQFVPQVRAVTTTSYRYVPGADPARLMDLVRSGVLQADDPAAASGTTGEDIVVDLMRADEWDSLVVSHETPGAESTRVRRRWFLQPLDYVREKMPVGDR